VVFPIQISVTVRCLVFEALWGRGRVCVWYVIYHDFFVNICYMDDFLIFFWKKKSLPGTARISYWMAEEMEYLWLLKIIKWELVRHPILRFIQIFNFDFLFCGGWWVDGSFFIFAFTWEPNLPLPLVPRLGAPGILLLTINVGAIFLVVNTA